MFLEARLQPLEDLDGLLDRRLGHIDLLEASRERCILLEDAAVLGKSGRTDAFHRARRQGRLEQVAGIQRPAGCRTGTDQGVDFVDEENRVGLILQLFQHGLQPLLEIAPVFGPGQQGAHVERINHRLRQHIGHCSLGDAPCQAFGDRGLADTGFTHQQRIVLAPATEDLHDPLDLGLAADQGIDLAVTRELVQVLGELVQRRTLALGFSILPLSLGGMPILALGRLRRFALLDAMGNEVHHIEPGDPLLMQVINRMRVLLAKDRHQHIGAGHFLLAAASGLDMHDGALDDALEPKGRLGVNLLDPANGRRVFLDELPETLAQVVEVGRTGTQYLSGGRVVQQGHQQMLDGDEFMALLARFDKRHMQADFKLLRNHAASKMHCKGWPARLAAASTRSTLVAATSLLKTPHTARPSWWILSMIWVAVSRS